MLIYKFYPKIGVMLSKIEIENKRLFEVVKTISNEFRFKIVELSQHKELTVTELSSILGLSYNKCADYIRMLNNKGLIEKTKDGKNVRVKSRLILSKNKLLFD